MGAATQRIEAIDALRGFALLGILFANIGWWVGLPFAQPEHFGVLFGDFSPAAFAAFFNGVLDGKFYTLFSFLFGLGFALQLDRLEKRGADGMRIFRRRTAILLAIGLVHVTFIWAGDILVLYALLGFLLPSFHRMSDRGLLLWGLALVFPVSIAGPMLMETLGVALEAPFFAAGDAIWEALGYRDETHPAFEVLSAGSAFDLVAWNLPGVFFNVGDRLGNWRVTKVLGTMVLGLWSGRRLVEGSLIENSRLLWGTVLVGVLIGVPASISYAQLPPHSQNSLASQIGTLPLGLAYGAAFLLAFPVLGPFARIFTPVGRMALTNYLSHSLVCNTLFLSGIGLGLMGRISVLQGFAMAAAIFVFQIGFSTLWLSRYSQGPMEALWRRLTYGSWGIQGLARRRT